MEPMKTMRIEVTLKVTHGICDQPTLMGLAEQMRERLVAAGQEVEQIEDLEDGEVAFEFTTTPRTGEA